jgi:malic enzyme
VGLGVIASRAREVTDRMFLVAATTLAGMVDTDRLAEGALYPSLAELRPISRAVAIAVACEASASGVAPMISRDQTAAAVDATIWTPEYGPPAGPAEL